MRAGGLDRRVTLQRFTVTTDDYGEEIQTWNDLATVFAEVRQQSGREFIAAAQVQADRLVVFFIRWFAGLTVLDRVSYAGTLHDIVEVREIGRRDGVELHTVAAV
jgi:SPP1 family predicted phage head-tail adaptor